MALYAMSSVARVSVIELTRELVPFMISIFAVLVLITFVPAVVTWLPRLIMG
jgi:TRAP-type C4-dicarboxylate transport system permease large subunit